MFFIHVPLRCHAGCTACLGRAASEAARARSLCGGQGEAGRSPDAQVKLALWCEAHGLTAERAKHLTLATLIDPLHATGAGTDGPGLLPGKVAKPRDEIVRQVQEDPAQKALLREYLQRRARTPDRADDQWKLALVVRRVPVSRSRPRPIYYQVLKHEPGRDAAWKRLGFKKVGDGGPSRRSSQPREG